MPFLPNPRSHLPRARAALLALALVALSSSGAVADTKSELAEAKEHLVALEDRIAQAQAAAADLLRRSTEMASEVAARRTEYEATEARVAGLRADLAEVRKDLGQLRRQLDDRAAALYMGERGSTLEALLGAPSFADFTARLQFVSQVADEDAELLLEIARGRETLRRQAEELVRVEAAQRRTLTRLEAQDRELDALFARQQEAVADLAAARAEAADLVATLDKQLRAEARALVAGGGPFTFGNWSGWFLPRVGAPTCHQNMVVVVSWAVAEYTAARYNPLATSYPMPGATNFTSGGVKSYVSLDQGLKATELTLEQGSSALGYGPILSSLRSCGDAMETARAIDASSWCGCGAYVQARVPGVEAEYDHFASLKPPY